MERIAYVSQKWHYIGSKPLFMNDELFANLISNSDTSLLSLLHYSSVLVMGCVIYKDK